MTLLKKLLTRRRVPLSIAVVATAIAVPTLAALNPLAASQGASSGEASGAHPQLASTLGVFAGPRANSDALPAALERSALVLNPGLRVNESRKALTTSQGTELYLVPEEEEGVCLLASNSSLAPCYSLQQVAKGAVAASDSCSPSIGASTIEVGGVIPAGASDPIVVFSDGSTRPLSVANNAYLEDFPKSGPTPAQISWRSASGTVTVSANVPAGAASEQCVASPSEVEALVSAGKIPAPSGHPPSQPTQHVEYNGG